VPIFRSARLYTMHHCAHLQECKTVHYCIWFSALNVLTGVLGRWEAGHVHMTCLPASQDSSEHIKS